MPYFIWPTDTERITSHFNPKRRHPVTKEVSYHSGLDIAQSGSHPIFATASGVVVRSDAQGTYGEVTMIEHKIKGVKYTSVYAHMRQGTRGYNVGDKVKQGSVIGYMGNTGRSTGQHLHFELHMGTWNASPTNAVDPYPYLFKGFYSKGDKGPDVGEIQTKLKELGFYKGNIDGDFGNITDQAVRDFQGDQDITVDGVAGPTTLKYLKNPKEKQSFQKEELEMLEKAIVINSFADFPNAEILAIRLGAPIYLRSTAEKEQVAKEVFVVGGGKDKLKADKFTVLAGADRYETAAAVKSYLLK